MVIRLGNHLRRSCGVRSARLFSDLADDTLRGVGKLGQGLATAGTVLKPSRPLVEYLSSNASNTLTRALVVVATPQHAPQLASLAKQFPNIQTIGAAVDTVGLGAQRDGFSWMVFEHAIEIHDRVHPATDSTDRNWTLPQSAIRFTGHNGTDIALPAANTLFTTGQPSAIYAGNDQPLAAIHVEVPVNWEKAAAFRPVTPLTDILEITSVQDNMLKTLDSVSAASHLEKAETLLNEASPERAVYAELFTGEGSTLIKVVAGGGGLWSPRSRMLVLEPPASPRKGDRIRFLLSTGKNLSEDSLAELQKSIKQVETRENAAVFEVAPVNENLDDKPFVERKRNEFVPVFAAGSEQGFEANDSKYSVPGESLVFSSS